MCHNKYTLCVWSIKFKPSMQKVLEAVFQWGSENVWTYISTLTYAVVAWCLRLSITLLLPLLVPLLVFLPSLQWPYAILKLNICVYFILPIMLLYFLICYLLSESWNNLSSQYLNLAFLLVKLFFKYASPSTLKHLRWHKNEQFGKKFWPNHHVHATT